MSIKIAVQKTFHFFGLKSWKNGPLVFQVRPESYVHVLTAHLPSTLISGFILVLPKLVSSAPWLWPSCLFLKFTGYPCPFCGFTRSFLSMAEGEWIGALNTCPLAFFIYLGAWIFFAWHAAALIGGVKIETGRLVRFLVGGPERRIKFWLIVFFLNWTYRLSLGFY